MTTETVLFIAMMVIIGCFAFLGQWLSDVATEQKKQNEAMKKFAYQLGWLYGKMKVELPKFDEKGNPIL